MNRKITALQLKEVTIGDLKENPRQLLYRKGGYGEPEFIETTVLDILENEKIVLRNTRPERLGLLGWSLNSGIQAPVQMPAFTTSLSKTPLYRPLVDSDWLGAVNAFGIKTGLKNLFGFRHPN